MASSEVDQKALGNFAAATSVDNPVLSTLLYKILGLSVMLSKRLLRARRFRRLDTTRETKSLQLYHHILWLSREGLLILEQFVLLLVEPYVELKVLAYKLRASFYHIFALFHNQPAVRSSGIAATASHPAPPSNGRYSPAEDDRSSKFSFNMSGEPILSMPGRKRSVSKQPTQDPPAPDAVPLPKSASSFILPSTDYTLTATICFDHAVALAERSLPGSHPLRLSVKLEYAAYLYDCLHDRTACRQLAKQAIADVYSAQEGMDDEAFEDAAEIVRILGRVAKRAAVAPGGH